MRGPSLKRLKLYMSYSLNSFNFKGGYVGDYIGDTIGDYCKANQGGYSEFRLQLPYSHQFPFDSPFPSKTRSPKP